MYTTQCIKKGDFILEYVGELINNEEMLKRRKANDQQYMFQLTKNVTIDAMKYGNYSRYINHSCNPNCEAIIWRVNNKKRVGIFALNKINAYNELTMDYEYQKNTTPRVKCLCKSSNCRKFI